MRINMREKHLQLMQARAELYAKRNAFKSNRLQSIKAFGGHKKCLIQSYGQKYLKNLI